MPEGISSSFRLFADDTVIYRQINSEADHTIIQQDLHKLARWEAEYSMEFHSEKCNVLRVTRSRSPSILTTNLAECVCVCVCLCVCAQNVTHFIPYALISSSNFPNFFLHSKIPIRCLWTAFCVPLSYIFYEKQYFEWSMYAECNSGPLK